MTFSQKTQIRVMTGISETWEVEIKGRHFLHLLDGDYVPGNILSVSHIFSHLLLVMTL